MSENTGVVVLGLALVAGAFFAGTPEQDPRKPMEHRDGAASAAFIACSKACSDCQRACDGCAKHCAEKLAEGKSAHRKTLASCAGCAEACSSAARLTAAESPYAVLTCRSCATICGLCAEECERMPEDEVMKRCAEECRRCEKACAEMAR
jgi:hypothetical protein